MIQDIPTSLDFENTGLSLLNYSWESAISLLEKIHEAPEWGIDVDEVKDDYWDASKQSLMTSLSIAQQGIEFVIKGKIATISPYLLIAGSPKEWPRKCQKEDISFSEFKTIDAQDLIKVYNTFSDARLDDPFITKFEELRTKRNSIMHSINMKLEVHALEIISEILWVYKYLFPSGSWVTARRNHIQSSPMTELVGYDMNEYEMVREFSMLSDLLKPVQMKEYFGVNKKQRFYICPVCAHETRDFELEPKTAQLSPNKSNSTNLYCFVCQNNTEVTRKNCIEDDCKGNVISNEYEICTTCGYDQG